MEQGIRYIIRNLGITEFADIYDKMKQFCDSRSCDIPDEIWVLQHKPVFTIGASGNIEDIISVANIPICYTDRGGKVTYHGYGQIIIYTLIDLKRLGVNIRDFVVRLENAVIDFLSEYDISAYSMRSAPGVYVGSYKIASLGLKIRNGSTYHGLSFNCNMDMSPFEQIVICGNHDLRMTQLSDFKTIGYDVSNKLANMVVKHLYG